LLLENACRAWPTAPAQTAYRALFGLLTVMLFVAVAIYSRSQDIKPSDEMRARRQGIGA
jgi:hypothetical protein